MSISKKELKRSDPHVRCEVPYCRWDASIMVYNRHRGISHYVCLLHRYFYPNCKVKERYPMAIFVMADPPHDDFAVLGIKVK